MFWRFGGYANTSTLNTILEKPDVTLEEVLEEADLIQQLKDSNSKLIEFLRDENVLRRLLEYVTAPQAPKLEEDDQGDESEEEAFREKSMSPFRRTKKEKSKRQEEVEEWDRVDKQRTKLAYTASEVLSSDTWSIIESLIESQELLKTFWDFLRRPPPLDPTEAGYFTKINETLLDKKTEEMIRFLLSMEGIIPAMLNHIDCAAVMDLLLKIISMEKSEGGYGVVDVSLARKRPWPTLSTDQHAVATKPRSGAEAALLPGEHSCSKHPNIRRRFHEGNRHHLRQCVTERTVMHRSKQSHPAACLRAVHGELALQHAQRRKPFDSRCWLDHRNNPKE